jgi:nicotinate-nucleotide adenylyltransferase
MIRLAIRGNARLAVSDIELRRGGVSYTVDMLRAFRKRLGGWSRLCFLVGADSLRVFHDWKDVDQIVRLARVIVISRPAAHFRIPRNLERAIGVKATRAIMRNRVEMPLIGVSATQIRQRLAQGQDIRYLVPELVLDYIRRKRLY